MLVCFCSKAVGKFVLVGTVAHFVLFLTLLLRSLYLIGDLFVFRVLFAFGFGHRFSCWFFVSVWEYFLSGSVRYCSEYVIHVLRGGFSLGMGSSLRTFYFFSCVSLRICLGKWCSVWDFDFLFFSYPRH